MPRASRASCRRTPPAGAAPPLTLPTPLATWNGPTDGCQTTPLWPCDAPQVAVLERRPEAVVAVVERHVDPARLQGVVQAPPLGRRRLVLDVPDDDHHLERRDRRVPDDPVVVVRRLHERGQHPRVPNAVRA